MGGQGLGEVDRYRTEAVLRQGEIEREVGEVR